MRTAFIIVIVVILSIAGFAAFSGDATAHDVRLMIKAFCDEYLELSDAPSKVRSLAAPGAKRFGDKWERRAYVAGFSEGFLSGLTSPGFTVTRSGSPDEPGVIGFTEGRAAALAPEPGSSKITLKDYGWVQRVHTGYLAQGFENSWFVPFGKNEQWWVSSLVPLTEHGEIKRRWRREHPGARNDPTVKATLSGFLSPSSDDVLGYGHLGSFDREFVVTEVIEMHVVEK